MTELSLFTMHYISWLWHNSRGIRWNTAVRIVTGIGQLAMGTGTWGMRDKFKFYQKNLEV